jgi:hypothetical protein
VRFYQDSRHSAAGVSKTHCIRRSNALGFRTRALRLYRRHTPDASSTSTARGSFVLISALRIARFRNAVLIMAGTILIVQMISGRGEASGSWGYMPTSSIPTWVRRSQMVPRRLQARCPARPSKAFLAASTMFSPIGRRAYGGPADKIRRACTPRCRSTGTSSRPKVLRDEHA